MVLGILDKSRFIVMSDEQMGLPMGPSLFFAILLLANILLNFGSQVACGDWGLRWAAKAFILPTKRQLSKLYRGRKASQGQEPSAEELKWFCRGNLCSNPSRTPDHQPLGHRGLASPKAAAGGAPRLLGG